MRSPRKFSPEFKVQVVLDMLVSGKTYAQASREYKIKDSLLARWKQEFLERAPSVFDSSATHDERDQRIAELERMVGRLAMELQMLKKASSYLNSHHNESETSL